MIRKTIASLALATTMIGLGAAAASATIVQEEPKTWTPSVLRVTDYEKLWGGRARVWFNDGSVVRAGACPEEDSWNCWWDAGTAGIPGSGGYSFIDMHGKTYYLDGLQH